MMLSFRYRPVSVTSALILALLTAEAMADPPNRDTPDESDLRKISADKIQLVDRLLTVIEKEIIPKTEQGVRGGSKLFGGAVLNKSDLSTVVASTNVESNNPLMHGEITTIFDFYDLPKGKRPDVQGCIFLATHEPCPLCLSGITWAGFDNFFYLFTYEDSRDAFNIPHDIQMHQEIFRIPDANYAAKNRYWSSWGLKDLIASCSEPDRKRLASRVDAIKKKYDELSQIYQQSKDRNSDIPLD